MRFGFIDVLSDSQTKQTVDTIHSLDKCWIRREREPVCFYTLGATTYIDAVFSNERYHKHKKALNPLLLKKFSWVYDILLDKLSAEFGPCVLNPAVGYPGFHVFGTKLSEVMHPKAKELMEKPLASLHVDIQYREHYDVWDSVGNPDYEEPLSFTLPLELPSNGGGLFIWDWKNMSEEEIESFNFQDQESKEKQLNEWYDPRDDDEFWYHSTSLNYNPIYDSKPKVVEYKVGRLFYHTGHVLHQIIPGFDLKPDDRRITLQGHGIKCDGVWQIYF